jgi:murein DD-endopeptidase MepM/ murein hydrolase activator NlpD
MTRTAAQFLRRFGALLALGTTSCDREPLRGLVDGYTPHERYEIALLEAGLAQTALGRDWMVAAGDALERPVTVAAPYQEESYLDPRQATAAGYRVALRRGQRLLITWESAPDSGYQVFLDLFAVRTGPGARPRHLTNADSLDRHLEYVVRRDGDYLIRLQPELLRGGRYRIAIVVEPTLQFPVEGHDTTAIRSWYGADRDAGRRRHEGLDIFAARGTPVLAAADGVIRSTRPNNLGGTVVWLRDDLDRTHYYAHLDSHIVRRGLRVRAGDTIAFVGNSGNARTTPPHLHFGLYARGSFDPYPALFRHPPLVTEFSGDRSLIGRSARVGRDRSPLMERPSGRAPVAAALPLHTPLSIRAGSGNWYRVALLDGSDGYVEAEVVESSDQPIRREVLATGTEILARPTTVAIGVDSVIPGEAVGVLGVYGDYLYVRGPSGRSGWLLVN